MPLLAVALQTGRRLSELAALRCPAHAAAAADTGLRKQTAITAARWRNMARLLGLDAHVLVPRDMAAVRRDAIRAEGARITVVSPNHDDAVRHSAALAHGGMPGDQRHGWTPDGRATLGYGWLCHHL